MRLKQAEHAVYGPFDICYFEQIREEDRAVLFPEAVPFVLRLTRPAHCVAVQLRKSSSLLRCYIAVASAHCWLEPARIMTKQVYKYGLLRGIIFANPGSKRTRISRRRQRTV